MRKNLFWLVVTLMLLSMVAAQCGSPATPAPAEKTEEKSEAKAEPTKEETKEEAAAPATAGCDDALGCVEVTADEPIKLAAALVIAGPNATLGIDSRNGVEIAIDDHGGKAAGHAVELVSEDEGCSAEGGQTAAQKVSSDSSVVAVIGHNCSSSCTPAASIYDKAGMTMISPSCTAPALTDPSSHVPSFLRTAHNDNVQGRVMAEYVYNKLGLKKAATIHDGSPYAEQLQQVFATVFKELGGEITAQEAINVGDTDMRPVLTSIAAGKPEFIYYPIFIAEGGFITVQAKEIAGLETVILAGADGMISPDFLSAAGKAGEGMVISGPDLNFSGDAYKKFLEAHQKKFGGAPPSAYHAHAYDAATMILNAIDKVAKTDAAGKTIIGRKALRDALYATKDFKGITGNLSCNENGDCADPKIGINTIKDGKYIPVTDAADSGAAKSETTEAAAQPLDIKPIRIAIVMPSTVTDLAWSQSLYDSLLKIQTEAGGDKVVEIAYSESMFNVTDAAAAIRDYASNGYDIIIAHGTQYGTSLFEIAPDFPETSFAWGTALDTGKDKGLKNVFAYEARAEQGGYVNGVLAATLSKSNVIGVVGPVEAGDAKLYIDGFVAGAKATKPDIKVNVSYTGSFGDTALAAEAANTHIKAGADILTGSAQQVVGAIGVAKEKKVFWLGTQADQSSLAPEIVVATQEYDWHTTLVDMIKKHQSGEVGDTAYSLSLENGGLNMKFATTLPADAVTAAQAAIDGIKAGTIKPE
jgi:ABC-type branched-subunit amino acid transport system substrate-binding protein/basic membrane lipoprotein Med (substrate-binding protein (PBP1-ABC) superfamily)